MVYNSRIIKPLVEPPEKPEDSSLSLQKSKLWLFSLVIAVHYQGKNRIRRPEIFLTTKPSLNPAGIAWRK
jgi:hypothetical protein